MSLAKPVLSIVLVLPCLAGCAMFSNEVAGVRQVDDLVGRVERVHLEADHSQTSADAALEGLHAVVTEDFTGDAMKVFDAYVDTVDASEKQARTLRDTVGPMRESANAVFAQWEADLQSFSSPDMRNRSRSRMEATRARYQAVVDSVERALSAYDAFNLGLRDHATFLQNDFNAASVAEIRKEVQKLSDWGQEVDRRLAETKAACDRYVAAASLPGTVDAEETQATGSGK